MTPDGVMLRQVSNVWHDVNTRNFRGALRAPLFQLGGGEKQLGGWQPLHRTFSISRQMILEQPWGAVVEVIKHEMAHQYAWEVLGAKDETAHGPAFREVCRRYGFDAASHGMPNAVEGPEDRVMRRAQKLLALAQSSNPHEAEAAMNAAQRIMLEHNIATTPSSYVFRHLGTPTSRLQPFVNALGGLVRSHFFVEAVWVHVFDAKRLRRGKVLEVIGTRENVEMAAYVYEFVLAAGERLWKAFKKEQRLDSDGDRRVFLHGVVSGFSAKLAAQTKAQEEVGLVWVGDAGLQATLDARYPRRVASHRGGRWSPFYDIGKEKGWEIVLHRPVAADPARRGRLLT